MRHLDIFPHKREVAPGKFVWFISGCRTCGLVFIDPLPSEQQVENLYAPDGKWVKEKVEQFISEGVLSSEPNMSNDVGAAPAVWRAIDGLPIRTGSVLDFGCGRGSILEALKERGWETYGVDPATAPLLRDRGHLMLDEMPEAPAFDLVIIKHVLEHIRDPLTILRQARKCIRDGGYLFVGTPSLDRLTEHEKLRYCINPSKHIVAFTTRSMRNLLAMAEFRVDTILEPDRPQRLALLARPAADVPHEPAPLRDARRELRAFLIQKEGRLAAWTPVRRRAFIANAKILREHQRRQAARTVKPGKANRSASPGGARERSA